MLEKLITFIRKNSLPLFLALVLLILIGLFHDVMTPFVIALIVVYLMEPLVGRLSKRKIRKKQIPRWLAVISVYIVFFSVIAGFGFLFVPSLTAEIGQATEELPAYFTKVKDEKLPTWSAKFNNTFFFHDKEEVKTSVAEVSQQLSNSLDKAIAIEEENMPPTILTEGSLFPHIGLHRDINYLDSKPLKNTDHVLFKLRKAPDSDDMLVLAGDEDIKIDVDSKGSYIIHVKEQNKKKETSQAFNLEREINRGISAFLEQATHYIGNALSFLQYILVFLINAFVQSILVFMLAAFISIDLPKIMQWLRGMFENERGDSSSFDELVNRFDRALSGVIRGQLLVCCINGTLTAVGLWVLGVDFALLLGIIAGVLSIIPIFGTIISTIPAVLLGLVQGSMTAVFVLAWILLIHFIDANFMTPKIVGSSSHLHPVVIIFALLAGQTSFGVLGMILAMPVTSLLWTVFLFTRDKLRERRALLREQEMAQMAEETVPPTVFESATTPAPESYDDMGTITNAEESRRLREKMMMTQENQAITRRPEEAPEPNKSSEEDDDANETIEF